MRAVYAELRVYTIHPDAMDAWLAEWREHVYPLRLRLGFRIPAAWVAGDDRFVWVLAYDGEDFEAANQAYYASAERRAVQPEPSRHVRHAEHWPLRPVLGETATGT
jgi:hypothetical protein